MLAAAVIGLAAAVGIGCGAESHPNEPRPAAPTRVSVTISDKAVTVAPAQVAVGPEPRQQILQNREAEQPEIQGDDSALDVVIVAANQTTENATLQLRGPKQASSRPIPANSPGSFPVELPTGTYTISVDGVPGAKPAKLQVGPRRSSSENDVLLP